MDATKQIQIAVVRADLIVSTAWHWVKAALPAVLIAIVFLLCCRAFYRWR